MARLPKILTSALSISLPDVMAKLAKSSAETAMKFKEAALLLDKAAESFVHGDPTSGLELLKHAQDRLDRKD